ncbi:hypothetical protein GQ44DRAFT_825144 [Phaeosphaeriaceae sp. PMI808]|nr:hypothetical protein GQ44DRAFT_825144 [Phaeosphaeriaceae sp. PMI808]
MDPFGITAGAIGITGVATASISQLHSLINGLGEAQDIWQDIVSSLEGIQRPLAALEKVSASDDAMLAAAKEDLKRMGVPEAVNKCGVACDAFGKNLRKWTKHSHTTKISLRDRLSLGVWNKEKIRTLRIQLQTCEATVQFAVTSTQLIVQLRAEKLSEIDRKNVNDQLQALETKIHEYLDLAKRQQDDAQERERMLRERLDDDDDDDDVMQQESALKEVEEQSRLLEAGQIDCGVVFSQVRSKRSGQDIGKVITSVDSRAIVGLPESVVGKINQRIREVRTERGSKAVVGVFSGDFNMKDF